MVIHSSVILTILQDEPEQHIFNQAIAAAEQRRLSALSLLEVSMVVEARFGSEAQQDLDLFLPTAEIVVVPFDLHLAQLALSAFQRYGKGRHPAALNMGDCCSCALAQACSAPLLFKGNDFGLTDIQSALAL
jgi:ribonuclease VapC